MELKIPEEIFQKRCAGCPYLIHKSLSLGHFCTTKKCVRVEEEAELYNSINSAEARLEAYIDEEALRAQLDTTHINISDIETDINFRMATFLFLPHQLDKFDEVISLIGPDTKMVVVSELSYFEKFKETLTQTREDADIRSLGMILSKMCDIVLEHYAEMKKEREEKEKE